MTRVHSDRPTGVLPQSGGGDVSVAPDTRGDLQAANRAASAFNGFTSTIEAIVARLPNAEQVFDETGQVLEPVDTHALSNKVDGLNNLFNLMKGEVSEAKSKAEMAQKIADSSQRTANTAMSIAKKAMSKATVNSVMMSDAETPSYVKGGGPQ